MRSFRLIAASILSAAGLSAQTPATAPRSTTVAAASATIRAEDFRWRVSVLAHDSMRGRETPSPQLDAAASWIASEFRRFGLKPGGDEGGFVQRYPIPGASWQSAPNVVGILEGSDPSLRGEYVVISAHMDHVGVGRPDARGDSIFNGADDNASGTATVIEIAEAMASLETRPRRSILFALVSGEEKGLWGSAHLVDHPPVAAASMVADLNVDMVGRNWKDTIVVIGREHSDLGSFVTRAAASAPELGIAVVGDLWPREQFYFRSDHYNFARRGVPAIFFFNGVHEDYHRPSDHWEKIDTEKAARVARLVLRVGLEVANSEQRPRWNPESYRRIVVPPGA